MPVAVKDFDLITPFDCIEKLPLVIAPIYTDISYSAAIGTFTEYSYHSPF
jgi:hypothetical protein